MQQTLTGAEMASVVKNPPPSSSLLPPPGQVSYARDLGGDAQPESGQAVAAEDLGRDMLDIDDLNQTDNGFTTGRKLT